MNINEMIYKTLKTKANNPVKFENELKEHNLIVITEDTNSTQNYVKIQHTETKRELVISKDRVKKTSLFDPWATVADNKNIKKVDFMNYFTKTKYKKHIYGDTEKEDTMFRIKREIRHRTYSEEEVTRAKRNLRKAQEELEKAQKRLDKADNDLKQYKTKFRQLF